MPSPSLATEGETSYVSDAKPISEDELSIENKFEPEFWEEVQTSLSNGTMKDLSLIIRLVRDKRITGMKSEELKNHAVSLFTNNCNATVYSVCDVLPVIMATVSVTEAEKIATYEFVESIGDGDRMVHGTLDVSRPAIGADNVEATLGFDGNGITIAILDTGIDNNHPDLDDLDDNPGTNDPKVVDNISWVDWDDDGTPDVGPADNHGHGTHVAGTAAGTGAQAFMGQVYRGIAPGAWLMNVKVLQLQWQGPDPGASGEMDDIINGIDYAVNQGADVISMSLGGFPGGDGTSELAKAADDAVESGLVVVAAAGNEWDLEGAINTPGDAFNVITVGAVDDINTVGIQDDTLAWFSSRGPTVDGISKPRPKPDVVAPGENIIAPIGQASAYWQTYPNERVGQFHASMGGTSMATPHVSGTVALMLEANPNLTPAQVKAILRQTARLNDNLNGLTVNDRGHGIIDALAAVQLAQNTANVDMYRMYDSFDVTTPSRDLGWWCYDYVTFTVGGPSSTYGINLRVIDYHYRHPLGIGNTDYRLLYLIGARHVWIDDTYYDLALDMDEYLFSGPRIISEGSGYVYIRALYRVNNVFVEYLWKLHVDEMYLWLYYSGGSSWKTLMYIDMDVWGNTDYAYLPSTSEHIYYERKVTGDTLLDVGDLDHSEYIEIDPFSLDNPIMWTLRIGYTGNNPDTALDGQYICDRDIVVYYQGTSNWPGGVIYRKTSGLPKPRPTLTVLADYGGTISPPPGLYQYDLGTQSDTFTASPNTDYNFDGWTLDGDTYDTSRSTSVPMDAPHTLKAWFSYKYSSCVAEGTLVTMADGSTKPVEDIKKGDQVLGYDPTTGSYMAENVLDTIKHQVEVLVNINNGRLRVTPTDQPIFIRNSTYEGWVRDPATIQVGWEVFQPGTGTWVTVTSMTYEEGKTRVYDLVLDGYQTFIANGILLMDKC